MIFWLVSERFVWHQDWLPFWSKHLKMDSWLVGAPLPVRPGTHHVWRSQYQCQQGVVDCYVTCAQDPCENRNSVDGISLVLTGPSQCRAEFLEAQNWQNCIISGGHFSETPVKRPHGLTCCRKYLVTYPSSRRRMVWDLLGLILVIWETQLQVLDFWKHRPP